jgi:hypothetical protein
MAKTNTWPVEILDDACAENPDEATCVSPCNWCTYPDPAHCQTATCGQPPAPDCSDVTDPALCVIPCFWYKQYIWNNTDPEATCHDLMEMLTDNWFIPAAAGVVLLLLLARG